MKKYHVNEHAQSNGDHEVHNQNCPFLPLSQTGRSWGRMRPVKVLSAEQRRPTQRQMAALIVHRLVIPGKAIKLR